MLLLLMMQATPQLGQAMDRYRNATRAAIDCHDNRPDDIVICGRREADRYRAPLTVIDPDDARNEGVPAERERLLARTNNCQEKSTFLVGCGAAGISVSTRTGVSLIGERPIAP
jgi:hypothetical protein